MATRESNMIENFFITTYSLEGFFINLSKVDFIRKVETSMGEWLHIYFSNGEITTIQTGDRELWNTLRKELLNQQEKR